MLFLCPQGSFYLLTVGLILGSVVFVFERILYKISQIAETKKNKMFQGKPNLKSLY